MQADQSSYHQAQIDGFELTRPNTDLTSELLESISPTEQTLQDLHNSGQQRDNQEESPCGSSIEGTVLWVWFNVVCIMLITFPQKLVCSVPYVRHGGTLPIVGSHW